MTTKQRLTAFLITSLIRLLCLTLRIRCHDPGGFFDPKRKGRFIAAAWHNRILMLPPCFERMRLPGQRLTVLTSASRDGGLLSEVVRWFGVESVRGSSSRRGASAIRELQAVLDSGSDVIVTPDGPRGPRYNLAPGLVYLSQKTGIPIVRVDSEYSRYWELKNWDRFRIPKPFARVTVSIYPHEPPIPEGEAALETARAALEARMRPEEESPTPAKDAA